MTLTETQIITAQLLHNQSGGASLEEMILQLIREHERSPQYREMQLGRAYYANQSPRILNKKRMVIGREGVLVEDKILSNNRIAHPFMRKLTRQKKNYLLAKPFSIETDDTAFVDAVQPYLNKRFYRFLRSVAGEAIQEGITWVRPYYDAEGALRYLHARGLQVIPLWADAEHEQLEAVVYTYFVERYNALSKEYVRKAEYHDEDGARFYTLADGTLQPDTERAESPYHFEVDGRAYLWERIPFIPFRYNEDETSLVRYIQAIIDSYDWTVSTIADLLDDIPTLVYVLKGALGTDLSEFRHNINQYKAVKVGDQGEVETLNPQVNIDAAEKHLERLRKDIYDAGDGVDTQNITASQISSDTFRMIYNGLDMDCQGMGAEFAASLEQLIWFIQFDIRIKTGQDFFGTEYESGRQGLAGAKERVSDGGQERQ